MSGRLAGTVAVITGGGAGIGAATCRRFAEEGADVAVVDTDRTAARETAETIEATAAVEAVAIEADVGTEIEVESMADTVESRFGRVDILVNNAGVRVDPGPVTEATEESWDRILDVNLKGAAVCAKHCVPLMETGGSVVNVASNGAEVGRPDWSQYDATKGGLVSMTKDMACDFAEDGIRVNAVSPGWVITDYHLPEDGPEEFLAAKTTPHPDGPGVLKRAAHPREIADGIVYLASDEASFVTGTNLRIDGGVTAVGRGHEWRSYE